jgi:hypothetical protein
MDEKLPRALASAATSSLKARLLRETEKHEKIARDSTSAVMAAGG